MMREAARRGHEIYAFEQRHMALERAWSAPRWRASTSPASRTSGTARTRRATCACPSFDAIIERKDPPFDMEYVYGTYLLELAEKQGARVFNRPSAIRDHNEKLAIGQFSQFTSPTLVTSSETRLRAFHAEHGDVIFKPLDGMGGAGIFRVKDDG
jgi:glutathione synthase